MRRESKILICVLGGLAIINLLVLDLSSLVQKKKNQASSAEINPAALGPAEMLSPVVSEPTLMPDSVDSSTCLSACKKYVQSELENLAVATSAPTPAKSSAAKVIYVPIGSSGSTTETSWTDIPGTDLYLDIANYPSFKSVSWEVSLQSYQSTNPVYIRLYDTSGKRAVDGSELSTSSPSYEYLRSGNLTIWAGNNLYRIQAKASAANTINFTSARLKITLE